MADDHAFGSAQQMAYRYIRDRIRSGKVRGGDRIVAEDIAAEISVSRMPVREAIRQLDSEGLLTIRPNRGAVVTEMTPDEVLELFQMRARLEGLAAQHAVGHLDDDLQENLQLQLHRLERSAGLVDEFLRHHEEFHRLICASGGRSWLLAETARLRAAGEPYLRLYFAHCPSAKHTQQDHERLFATLLERDPAKADEAMQHHILSTFAEVIDLLRR